MKFVTAAFVEVSSSYLRVSVKHYIHRVGRTARAGRRGRAISLVGEKERKLLKDIVKKATNPVKSRTIPSGEIYTLH